MSCVPHVAERALPWHSVKTDSLRAWGQSEPEANLCALQAVPQKHGAWPGVRRNMRGSGSPRHPQGSAGPPDSAWVLGHSVPGQAPRSLPVPFPQSQGSVCMARSCQRGACAQEATILAQERSHGPEGIATRVQAGQRPLDPPLLQKPTVRRCLSRVPVWPRHP